MELNYSKSIKWPKITFRGPILVPEVVFGGFWGASLYWSKNFDSGTRNAIFGTPKMAKTSILGLPKMAFWVPESKF